MARKTAIRITNAEIAAEQYRRDSRRDASENGAPMSALQLLRQTRDVMSEQELLNLARSAARLELRGDAWSSEDRADCASDVLWHILAERNGTPPNRADARMALGHGCHIAKNWRAAQLRRRALDKRAREAYEDHLAQSGAAMLKVLEMADLPSGYRAERERQAIDQAHRAAADAIDRLELNAGGPIHAVFYAWARGESAEQCAEDNGVSADAWEKRVARGKRLIRAAFPDGGGLVEALTDDSLPEIYRRAKVEWPMREGTDAGRQPTRPLTREEAISACLMRHQCPVPGLAAMNASRVRRGYLVAAPMVRSTGRTKDGIPTADAPSGYLRVPGKDTRQVEADARRNLARIQAQASKRERGVSYQAQTAA